MTSIALLARSPDSEHHHLFVFDGLRLAEPVDSLIAEVRCQHTTALAHAVERRDHDEHASRLEPPKYVLEEDPLHALVSPFANFEIERRVEVNE